MKSAWGLDVLPAEDWRLDAACRGYDPELWSLGAGRTGDGYKLAHRICHECPVQQPCRELAERTNSWGMIYGGLDFVEPRAFSVAQWGLCESCLKSYQRRSLTTRFCSVECRRRSTGLERKWVRRAAV